MKGIVDSFDQDIFNVVGSGGGGSVVALPTLYSNKEKMVGLWTDNKPLYQRTLVINTISSSTGVQRFAHNIANIDVAFAVSGTWLQKSNNSVYIGTKDIIRTDGSGNYNVGRSSVGAWVDATNITIDTAGDRSSQYLVITIQYTKTTDTPVEDFNLQDFGIFTPAIYSLEEREIGVWTDGKPLYQKTVDTGLIPSNTTKKVAHNVANIETIVKYYGIALNSSGSDARALPYVAFSDWSISLYVDETNISIYTVVNWENYYPRSYVTIQYTKTTDVAGSGSYAELGIPAVHIDNTERVIGTWFGETLYQKTLYDAGGKSGSFNINHGIENLKAVVNYSGCVTDVTYPMPLPRIAYDGNNVGIQSSGPTQIGVCNPTAFGTRLVDWYITIQYTKTTT